MRSTEKLPIVILISGNGSNLQAMIDSSKENLPIDIKAVISSKASAYGLIRADQAGLAHMTLSPADFKDRNSYDSALCDLVRSYSPKLVILAGFMRILGDCFLNQFKNKILNIHPSLLPKYPGLNTHRLAINAGDFEHGCSIHFVSEDLDSGPLIAQAVIKLRQEESVEVLQNRVHKAEHFLYPTVINWFCQERIFIKDKLVFLDGMALPKSGLKFILKSI
jgi:phosphoribosylglycinamide formyltransferase 1